MHRPYRRGRGRGTVKYLVDYVPKHEALTAFDACIFRLPTDREMHKRLSAPMCEHTHHAGETCWCCVRQSIAYKPRHKAQKAI